MNGQMKFKKREHTNCHEISQIQVKKIANYYIYIIDDFITQLPEQLFFIHERNLLQEPTNDRNKYKNTEHAYNLISQLLPLLKNIYLNQLNELEMIEPHRGKL